jgi:FkbM family methyltransferase
MSKIRQKIVASLTRRYALLSGCGTLANSRWVRLAAGPCQGLTWARIDTGHEILVPIDDYIGRALYFVGDLDRKVSRLIARLVRPGDTVMDVGANLGLVSMQLAALVGPNGLVHAFEPNPAMCDLLMQTIERNAARNIRLHRYALGVETGRLPLAIPDGHAGLGSLVSDGRAGWRRVEVDVRPLSEVVAELGVGPVRFLKIDVEGFEAEVLGGARAWLLSSPPDAILFELNRRASDFWTDPAIVLLRGAGYELYTIPKRLFVVRVRRIEPATEKAPSSHDFLAIQRDKRGEIASLLEPCSAPLAAPMPDRLQGHRPIQERRGDPPRQV